MISACNVMFNIGTGMENVTHLKNRTLFQYGAFKCGPAVNQCFRSLDFRDFLEKHLHFFIRYLMDILNLVKMLLDNIRLYFILS